MSEPADNGARKQRGRPFPKGVSGNPKGMATGSRHKATLILDQIGAEAGVSILQAVVHAAERGDMAAARIILDRAWPVRRGRPVCLDLAAPCTAADLAEAGAVVVREMARGTLTPEEGASVTAVIEAQRRIIETTELERRLAALEAAQPQKGTRR